MAEGSAPNYRPAPGSDRCDGCFFRSDNGTSCTRFPSLDDYRPNHLCDDFSMRSCAQRFDQDGDPVTTLEAHKQTIAGVEIFAKGQWNGKTYTTKDLDDMVKAAAGAGYKPPVSLGHNAPEDAPAYGYVVNVRREGDKLLADFEDVPDDLCAEIREKRYDQVSAEVYFDLKRGGKTWPRALRAVAVIGAHPPGVSDLKPLSEALGQFSAEPSFERVPYPAQETKMTVKDPVVGDEAAATIAKLTADLEAARTNVAAAADMQLTIQRLNERVAASERVMAETAERERQGRIAGLVKSLNRPPYRAYIQALAELATMGDKPGAEPVKVNFQAAGADAAAPTSAFGVLEDLVRQINQDVAHLFTESVRQGTIDRGAAAAGLEDPSAQLFELTGTYHRANPGISVDQARKIVTNDPKNADIVRRYNAAAATAN